MPNPKETRIGVVVHTERAATLFTTATRAQLNALGDVRWTDKAKPLTVDEACALLADCDVGVGSWGTPVPSAELMAACPRLRLWEHAAGSVKHVFGPHLAGRDLVVGSCAPALADNVAESVLAEIIIGLRRFVPNAAANRTAQAPAPADLKELGEATVGIVSASMVGRRVIALLAPFRPRVLVYDPFLTPGDAAKLGVVHEPDLVALCAASDVVSLHAPAIPATTGMIGARHLQAMRDDAVFINSARGACVDEAALCAELAKGRLFAFIDVTEPEPAALDSPLRTLPNVFLTSHITGAGYFKVGRQAVADIAAYLEGGMPLRPVTAEMLASIA
jgi:phosphoglycerate dehydrogenase-like enzyme